VNLRFYVRRGVVFVREIVPGWAIAKVAQVYFGERYMALPTAHKVVEPTSEGGRIQTGYRWRHRGKWSSIGRKQTDGRRFRIWNRGRRSLPSITGAMPATQAASEGDVSGLYGEPRAACLARQPDSALVAEGSTLTVHSGERLLPE
jgi:uncharacterized protein